MTTWLGVLLRGGMIFNVREEQGLRVALQVLGEDALEELRQHFGAESTEAAQREGRAVVEACLWMAVADRELDDEERKRLEEVIDSSELPAADKNELLASIGEQPELQSIAERIQSPALARLLLALAWDLAMADGRVDEDEVKAYVVLSEAFDVDAKEAKAIRDEVERARP